ncbi:MAG: sulfatase-like hydrolase/transferase, partial [Phycisphaerae bacterium]|nr:sulfatase-like hydrolase/transferase [Phycisphaerae bacterium]
PTDITHVILISIDTCRADYLSCYGYERETTPNIDALAREGVLFKNVVSPVPFTLPSHTTMLTGTTPLYHQVHDNFRSKLAPSYVTLAEVLKEAGFATGAVVSTLVLDSQAGLDQGFTYYNDEYKEEREDRLPNGRRAPEATRLASEWLEEHQGDDKAFLFLHYYDPHTPYIPPEPFASAFPGSPYAGEIAYTDNAIGEVIKKLKDLGLYDSSLIIITADHGEMLREHGESTHGYFIYESAIKVPLIIKVPGGPRGRTVDDDLVGIIDIFPTICGFLGISSPDDVQGRDLSAYITGRGGSGKQRYYYAESLSAMEYGGNSLLGVVTKRWKYIQTTKPELYDLDEDPRETFNLVQEQPNRAHLLQEHLKIILDEQSYKGEAESALTPDAERMERLESLGYIAGAGGQIDAHFDQTKPDPKDLLHFHRQAQRVNALVSLKKYKEAATICRQMILEFPENSYLRLLMGNIAFKLSNMNEAIVHFSKFISSRAEGSASDVLLGAFHIRTQAYFSLEQFEKAAAHLNDVLRAETLPTKRNLLIVHSDLGYALFKLGRLPQAVEHFDKALLLEPGDEMALRIHTNLAKAFVGQKKPDQAIEHWRRMLKLKPDQPEVLNSLGFVLAQGGGLDEAIEHWNKSLQLEPNQPQVHDWLGSALAQQGMVSEAIPHFTKAVEMNP